MPLAALALALEYMEVGALQAKKLSVTSTPVKLVS